MKEQKVVVIDGSSFRPGLKYDACLFRKDVVELKEVDLQKLGDPPMYDHVAVFRAVHDYATANGHVGGFPTFVAAGTGYSRKIKLALFKSPVAELQMAPLSELGDLDNDWLAFFRGPYWWAVRRGFATAFLTGHFEGEGENRQCGCVVLKAGTAFPEMVSLKGLGGPNERDVQGVFAAFQEYAEAKGFAAALPDLAADFWQGESEFERRTSQQLDRLMSNEGWRVAGVHPLGSVPAADEAKGGSHVHTSVMVILEKGE